MAATLQMLTEAQSAYHRLMTGAAVVKVQDQNGESVTYSALNAFRLSAYILALQTELGLIEKCNVGPMRPWF